MANILIVEDEEELREIFVEHLRDEGHSLFEASDGQQALEAYPSISPDLIVSDINMPNMDGYQFLEALQSKYPEVEDIPFFFVSALSSVDNQIKGLNYGIDEYLCKPVDLSLLSARIEASLLRQSKIKEKIARIAREIVENPPSPSSTDHMGDGLLASKRLRLSKKQQENIKSKIYAKNFHSASLINNIGRKVGISRLFLDLSKYNEILEDIASSEFDENFCSTLNDLFFDSVVHFFKREYFPRERAVVVPFFFDWIENENIGKNYVKMIDAIQKKYSISIISEAVNIPDELSSRVEALKPLSDRNHVQIIEVKRLLQIKDIDLKSLRVGAISMNYLAATELGGEELARLGQFLSRSNISLYIKEIPEGKISNAQMMKADLLSVSN